MEICRNSLEKALIMFKKDKDGIYLTGTLYNSSANILFNHKAFKKQDKNKLGFANNLLLIQQDLWNIATIVERMEWTSKSRHLIPHLEERAPSYLSVDIEHFHIEIRSIMDYCAKAIGYGLGLSGVLPSSFRKLKERSIKYKNKIPTDILNEIHNAKWFSELRITRDLITHRGASAMVFHDDAEKILFQIHNKNYLPHINQELIMHNENVVYFNCYAAYYISRILVFLETVFTLISKPWQFNQDFSPIRSHASGFDTIHTWCTDLLHIIDNK